MRRRRKKKKRRREIEGIMKGTPDMRQPRLHKMKLLRLLTGPTKALPTGLHDFCLFLLF
jgi:hypothetical protein